MRAQPASNSVAVTLTITGVAAGGEKLRMVSLDTAATAKLPKPPLRRKSPANTTLPLAAPGLPLHAQAQPDAPQATPCLMTIYAVSEANIGGAVSPEADGPAETEWAGSAEFESVHGPPSSHPRWACADRDSSLLGLGRFSPWGGR